MENPSQLVWVDIETSGLSDVDVLLEIAMVATTYDELEILEYVNIVLPCERPPGSTVPLVLEMHTKNNLWNECSARWKQDGMHSLWKDEKILFDFVSRHENFPMAGATVHFDRAWLKRWFPVVERVFHYRNHDVTPLKSELLRFGLEPPVDEDADIHRGLPDCFSEIRELNWIRKQFADAPWA